MPISAETRASYEVVLRDLEGERARVYEEVTALQRNLKELDNSISGLQRRMNPGVIPRPVSILRDPSKKYANISVRWAILDVLSDTGSMTSAEIAEALTAAGVKSKAMNFVNNVSAVLSTNMKELGEAQLIDGKWELTETGRNAIAHIRSSGKFRRACPWSLTPSTGSVGVA